MRLPSNRSGRAEPFENPGQGFVASRVAAWRSELGDSMIELLLAMAIIGVAALSILAAFATSINATGAHRNLATFDTVLRTASAEVTGDIQQQSAATFANCSGAYVVNTTPGSIPLPPTYSATITSVGYWNGSGFTNPQAPVGTGCPAGALLNTLGNFYSSQQVTVTVTKTGSSGRGPTSSSITNVVIDPTSPNSSGAPPCQYGPYQLAWVQQPATGPAGAALFPVPSVAVEDKTGCIIQSDASPVTLAITSGTGTAGATLNNCATSLNYGTTVFSGCSIGVPGTGYTLTASDPTDGLAAVTSGPFNITNGVPAQLVFQTQPGGGTGGTPWVSANQPTVVIEDSQGHVVTSDQSTVTLAIGNNPGNGTLSGCSSAPAVNGVATFTGCTIDKAGTGYTLTATDAADSLNVPVSSNSFIITVGPPSQVAFTTQPGNAVAGDKFATPPAVAVEDAGGNVVTTATNTVTLAIGTNPSSGTLSGCTGALNSGVTTFTGCIINNAGTGYTLVASASGLTPTATSTPFNVVAPQLSSFTLATPGSVTAGTAFTATITALDQLGYTYTGLNGSQPASWSGTATNAPNNWTPTLPSSVTFVNGVASGSNAPSLTLVSARSGATLTFTSNGVSGSSTFTINPDSATVAPFTVTGSPVTYGAEASLSFSATVTAGGNGMSIPNGDTVAVTRGATTLCTITLSSGSGSCSPSSGTVLGAGSYTVTATFNASGSDPNFVTTATNTTPVTVNAASTTTSVTSSSNPSVVGQAVTYTATVAVNPPGAGTPTGNVEFFDGGTAIATCGGASGNPLSGTSATCAVTYNATGSHTITAKYLGSANFSASAVSSSITQTVNAAATTTSVTSNHNPSVAGQAVTYTATVAVTAPGAGTPSNADTVTFKDGASTITCGSGSVAFNGTTATCVVTYASTAGSPHSITAVFGGDANYGTSTSSALTQTVNAAATTTSVASNHNPSVAGQAVTYTATVAATAPGAGTPSNADTVTFKDGASTITCGSGSVAFNGTTATCVVTYASTAGSPHSITAVFGGDANYGGSTSSALSQTVNKAATTTSVTSTSNPSVVGQQVFYTATVAVTAPGAGTPSSSDTVTFKDGASTITCGSGSTVFNGTLATCSATYNTTTGSPHSITAVFGGDANYATSTSSALTQTVNAAATTTSVTSTTNPSTVGQQVTYAATVAVTAPGAGTPLSSDTVTFKDGASTLSCGTGSVAFNGTTATCVVTPSTAGSHSITAVFGGDANYGGSTSSTLSQTVNAAATTTSVASTTGSPSVVGQAVTYTATVAVTSPGSGTPTGKIEFLDGGTAIATCGGASGNPLSGTSATCAVTYGTVGSHTITAKYLGDSNYSASPTSSSITQTVNAASTTTSVASSANPSVAGQAVTYTATVAATAPGAGTPSNADTVTFKDGASTITCGSGSVAFNGTTATCVVTYASTAGSPHSITAVFGGDANYGGSTSSALSQTVNKAATTTSVTSTSNPSVVGQQVFYTATVAVTAPGAGTPSSSDTVTFKDGASTITCGSGSTVFNGTLATCSATYNTTTGSPHSITAVFGGDANYATSTSSALTQTVNAAATTTSVTSTTNPSTVGQQVTYAATVAVTAPGAGTPLSSDTVTFKDGASTLSCGTGSVAFNGTTATCVVTPSTAGSHSITAVFGGDANYGGSTSSTLSQTVNAAATTTSVASTTGSPSVVGQAVTYTATVAVTSPGSGTPTGKIEFLDGGTAIATCGGASGNPLSGTSATCAVTYGTVGSHTITAKYLGDSNYSASPTSSSITQTVNAASTTTSVASSANPSVAGQAVTYTATVAATAPGAGTPSSSDTVTFKDGASTITCGSGSVAFNGTTATCVVTYASTAGSPHSITAVFGGDANYGGSTSSALSQSVFAVPTVTTGSSSFVSVSSQTVNGTVNPQGDSVTVQFCYSATASQVTSSSCTGTLVTASTSPATGTSSVSESATLTGLTFRRKYYYNLVVTGSGGTVTYGTPGSFTA